ncbi:hypothetical protein EIK77_010323 [Talaromyces pinophilus]|nr:hypothetical protein EIK77_010323 [Talaromyces pinophilus]PCG92816.1 hypothetical protein PENOC_090770 [Penicillium occitanis (nom. inval.)]PCG94682.1 Hypothetical protein PENO1_077270 [Penicillium occitanis (nom. inval.)]
MEQNESVPPASPETTTHDSAALKFTDEEIFGTSNDILRGGQHAIGVMAKLQEELDEARKDYNRLWARSGGIGSKLSPEERKEIRNLNREIKERGKEIMDIAKRVEELLNTP